MPYRTFVDTTGAEWQVWDIVPQLSERRDGETDRRVSTTPIVFVDRRSESRRLVTMNRAVLRGSYAQGWLCFESGSQKRRLTPIPSDWTTCSDELLESYMRSAERASGSYASVDSVDSGPIADAG